MSSVGIGSYLGEPETDGPGLFNSVVESVIGGAVNVIDTAVNYQYMRSEREVGAAIGCLGEIGVKREELLVCSKGGYLPCDFDAKVD
jgi:aryl-alcohol dehydrogenase-like predicted oxidoreductase